MTALVNERQAPGVRLAESARAAGLAAPPSGLHAIRILARTAWRRWRNRTAMGAAFFKREQPADGSAGRRKATPGKEMTPFWNSVVVAVFCVCLAAIYGCCFVLTESRQLSLSGGIGAEAAVSDPGTPAQGAAGQTTDSAAGEQPDPDAILRSGALWPLPPTDRLLVLAVGLALVLLSLCQLTAVLNYGGQDLGKVGWDMEYLFTLPVPAWTLFLGRLVQYATAGQMTWWCLSAPFLAGVYWCAGFGLWAIPLALAAMGYGALLTASLGLTVEILVQKRLSPAGRKNLQAVLGLVGGWAPLAFFMLSGFCNGIVASGLARAPLALWAVPFSLPALLCVKGWASQGAPAAMALMGVALPFGAVRLAGWLVRDGLVAAPNAHEGSRDRRRAAPGRLAGLFQGVTGKDLRLLMRDRAFLIRTLVLPVLLFGFYFVANWHDGISWLRDAHIAPVLAFWLGMLVLGYSAFQVLAAEGSSLWLLYTFPRTLPSILLEKTLLWSGLASLYVLAVLGLAALAGMPLTGDVVVAGAYAVAGIMIHAFIATAIGALAVNPADAVVQARPRSDLVWLYRFLWFFYLIGIVLPIWPKIVLVVLYAPLAFAFWQKAQDRIPYLLEPTEAPPPRISLADGMVAALAFFGLQIAATFLVEAFFVLDNPNAVSVGSELLVVEVVAGVVVTTVALFFLRRVPNLLAVVGLVPPRTGPRPTVRQVLVPGAAAGVLAGLFGVAYVAVLPWTGAVPSLRECLSAFPSPLADPGLFAVVVLAAPLVEEFLFRGLIYQGMERSMPPIVAVLVSAAIFAAVHPAISVIPVFVLGIAAALSFRRSRLLWTPILTHGVYNAVIMLTKLLIATSLR